MTPRRRRSGEGSIRERRGKDGRITSYLARLSIGFDAEGRRRVWQAGFPTRREARDALAAAIVEHGRGSLTPTSRETVAQFLGRWLPATLPTVGPKWQVELRRYCEREIVPRLGHVPLARVDVAVVQRLLADLQAEGRSAHQVGKVHAVLRHALNDAVAWRLLTMNPAQHVRPPKIERREVPIWTPEQVRTFLAAVASDPDRDLYELAILTGARAGELCGLVWSDVDWEAGTVSINRAVSRVAGVGLILKDTKSRAGRRLLALSPEGIAALRRQRARVAEWRLAKGEKWQDRELVFPCRDGSYKTADEARRKLERIAAGLGLPVLTFHQLRHLHGSLLVALGVSPRVVQGRLGHSSIDVTMDQYAHLLPGLDRDAAERLGRLWPDVVAEEESRAEAEPN